MNSLTVNGKKYDVDVENDVPLLWVLRDTLGLTGTKFGCGVGDCGACSVIANGTLLRSCTMPVSYFSDLQVTTIEGLAADKNNPVVNAWIEEQVAQCGYCQSGQIVAATVLLAKNPKPSDDEIDLEMTNICRCGTYVEIRKAIHRAAAAMAKR